jgi:hypothetical protein
MSDPAIDTCRGCSASVRLAPGEVQRILDSYLVAHPTALLVDEPTYARRLAVCRSCPDLQYGGTTCRHCGCLVAVRAKLADKQCPAVPPRWIDHR